jgi:hypothetical protein
MRNWCIRYTTITSFNIIAKTTENFEKKRTEIKIKEVINLPMATGKVMIVAYRPRIGKIIFQTIIHLEIKYFH